MKNDVKLKKKDERTNLWAFIIYPDDSAPDNYIEIIQSWHVPCAISPLHSPDENGDPDERFKQHIHVVIYFGLGQKKDLDQVKSFSDQLNGTRPFVLTSRNGYIRYLIHRDNPEKEQFEESDIICVSGFEIGDAFRSFVLDQEMYDYLESIIRDHKLCNMADLVFMLKETNCINELRFLRTHTYYIKCLLDDMYKRLKRQNEMLKNVEK